MFFPMFMFVYFYNCARLILLHLLLQGKEGGGFCDATFFFIAGILLLLRQGKGDDGSCVASLRFVVLVVIQIVCIFAYVP